MERGEEFLNFIPNHLGTQLPDFDGFYRARFPDAEDVRPRDRGGFQPLSIAAVLETIAIAMEIGSLCESPIEIDLAVALTKAIRVGEMPEPELRDDDVLIQIHAAGVNPLDSKSGTESSSSFCLIACR
jgi:hypothetical protein